ncbi:MAG TPA: lysophospholipid acyltransferase family protein [Gemmataceae bacterium]|nr:lysophospholipid acyltransferase family protein [Gemmataceae bacterium]
MEESWPSYLWYQTSYWLSAAAMTFGFSLRTQGHQHVPRRGPALLIANHQSFMDPILVGLAVRRHAVFLARQSLFRHRWLARLMRSLDAVPVNQEGFAREGLKTILEQLQEGRVVGIFPEGERTADGQIHPLRPGIHLLIKKLAIPIIPVGIAGAYDAWPRWRAYPIPAPLFLPAGKGTIAVSVGRPLDSRQFAGQPRAQVLADLFVELQKQKDRAERLRRKRSA